jgi:hypothetical protein
VPSMAKLEIAMTELPGNRRLGSADCKAECKKAAV